MMSKHDLRGPDGRFVSVENHDPQRDPRTTVNEGERWFAEAVHNARLSRHELTRALLDPRRDIDDEAGYPKEGELTVRDFKILYDREPVAARVNDVLPDESWMVAPKVFETENPEEETEFEESWKNLSRQLRSSSNQGSFFRGEKGNPIWEILHRADRLSGIGSFGVLLLGLAGSNGLETEPRSSENRQLLFLRAFDESLVSVAEFETNQFNPRFGQPKFYNIQLSGADERHGATTSLPGQSVRVHWKRVIHLADNLAGSEVFGIPRMRQVYNRLYDLRKLYAGSAEMYWRGAFPGLSIETNPRLGTNVDVDKDAMRDMMEQYMNGLQRYLTFTGMNAKSLAPQVVDPDKQIEVQIDAICIKKGIPKRIFKGSERGELASTQDDSTFNDRLRARQNGYLTPRVIVPFIDRLIDLGVLPTPESYDVVWPDLSALTDDEKAQVAERRSRAMMNYVTGGVETIFPLPDFLHRELDFTKGDVGAIVTKLKQEQAVQPQQPDDGNSIPISTRGNGRPVRTPVGG